jgi:hypothetical protein
MSAVTAISKIPWDKIAKYGPIIIATAGKLFESIRTHFGNKTESSLNEKKDAEISLADRISRLESNEVQQAELVSKIANQLGSLTSALEVVSKRAFLSLILSAIALVAALILIILLLMR